MFQEISDLLNPAEIGRLVQLFPRASHQGESGAVRGEAFSDAQVDSAAASCDERYLALQ